MNSHFAIIPQHTEKDLNLSYEDAIFIKIVNTKYDFQINNLLKKHC